MTRRKIHPAFPPPDRSRRRKMSPNSEMKIQMNMNQKKNTIIEKITSQNVRDAVPTSLHAASRTGSVARTDMAMVRRAVKSLDIDASVGVPTSAGSRMLGG